MKLKMRKAVWGQRHKHQHRPRYHCEVCESVIRQYKTFVMKYDITTDQIHTPSGLDIKLRRK